MKSLAMAGPALAFALLGLTVGCEPAVSPEATQASKTTGAAAPSEAQAREVLAKMADTYATAKAYEDVGELYYESISNGQAEEAPASWPYSISFERPNKLRVHAIEANIVSDGKYLRATLPGIQQILTLPAPSNLAIADILGDEILTRAVSGGITDTPLPILRLLTGERDLPGLMPNSQVSMLPDEKLGNARCQRVEVKTQDGNVVYWVDAESHLLKRMEFATDRIREQQKGSGNQVESLKIWADFQGARLSDQVDATAFEFESPPNAQLVRRFLPPPPQPPARLLGEEIGNFQFDRLGAEGSIDRKALEGKIVVFDFWATWCGWCFRGLPSVQRVYEKFQENDRVAIFAVDTDEDQISDDNVKKAFTDKDLHVPIARDREKFNQSVFAVEGLPTMVVLDGNGVVQHVHVGFDPNLESELTGVIDRLLKGENLAQEALAKDAAEREQYEREMNAAVIGTTASVELPESKIAEKTEPQTLKLSQQWSTDEVSMPGNLLVVGDDADAAIYALSGSRNIVQLDPAGKVVETFDLHLPRELGVSTLRTAVDGAGKRTFAVFANTQQQVFLFDSNWKQTTAYPDSQHSGISDAQLGDLDGDGTPELLVGYWGVVGVQAASLEGQRIWSNRKLENVSRLAVIDAEASGKKIVLAVNGRDAIMPISATGESEQPISVPGTALYAVVAAELNGTPPLELCALSSTELGALTAIGLAGDGKVQWEYPLPKGIQGQPVELVAPVSLPGSDGTPQGAWVFAGVDGTLHFLAADGTVIDKFACGEQLSGVATVTIDGKIHLLVATPQSITAWEVSR